MVVRGSVVSLLGSSLLGLLSVFAWPESTPDILVLTHANVVDTRTGSVGRNLTVVIKDGRIQALAKIGFIEVSRKVRVVNASDKYLIPGLWDMDVRSSGGPAGAWDQNVIYPLYVANGVTAVRDMGGDATVLEQRRDRIERGEILGPHMFFSGAPLDGEKSDSGVIAVNTPAEGRQAVHALKDRGADFIKLLSHLARDTYMAIANEAVQMRMRFVGQVPDSVSVAEASRAGQHSIENLSGVMLACSSQESTIRQESLAALSRNDSAAYAALTRQTFATYDPDKAWNLFTTFTDHNTYQVPALVWWRVGAALDSPELVSDPRLKYVPAVVRSEWDSEKLQQQSAPEQLADLKQEAGRYLELVHSMHRAGVPIMAGTEAPNRYIVPGFSLHDELEMLVKSGFSNADALSAATFYPALFMVKLDRYGVVEPGKAADMVLLDGNPLDDIRNTRKISAVILGGRYYPRQVLDRTLAQVAEAAGRQEVIAGTR